MTILDRWNRAHGDLDWLIAQYLLAHPEALPSTTSVLDFLQWSHRRRLEIAQEFVEERR